MTEVSKLPRGLGAMAFALGLTSCGGPSAKCSDAAAIETAKALVKQQIQSGSLGIQGMEEFSIQAVRTTGSIEANGGSQCAAEAKFPKLNNIAIGFTYTVEPTDDGKDIYVTVYQPQL